MGGILMPLTTDTIKSNLTGKPPVFRELGGDEVGQLCTASLQVFADGSGGATFNASVSKIATGKYAITFGVNMVSDTYRVCDSLLVNYTGAANIRAIGIDTKTASGFTVYSVLTDANGERVATDLDFDLTVFGGK